MKRLHLVDGRQGGGDHSRSSNQWVGGLLPGPFFIDHRGQPYRPDIACWMELPTRTIVHQTVVAPDDTVGAVSRSLREAMRQPAIGPPRRPGSIRVADPGTAAEVRAEVEGALPVAIGPTAELDDFHDDMMMSSKGSELENPSYFAGGRVPLAAVEKLFAAGLSLFRSKPWTISNETQVLRMDIPALGVNGACVSIVGPIVHSPGVLIFPGLDSFELFDDVSNTGMLDSGPYSLGSELLALTIEPASCLPRSMRREAMKHGWPVASATAYPLVQRQDADHSLRPLVERDVEIAIACAHGLEAFVTKHGSVFGDGARAPVCESFFDDGLEVRLAYPYEAFLDDGQTGVVVVDRTILTQPTSGQVFRPRAGLDDRCPCDHGRMYEECHLDADAAAQNSLHATAPRYLLDQRLARRLCWFALREFADEWERFEWDFADIDKARQLAQPWSLYCFEVDGDTVANAYLNVRAHRCSPQDRGWLDAQRAARVSVWEVERFDPGQTLTLHDLLTYERRTVPETRGGQLVPGDALLARVVDHEGLSLLCGVHDQPLSRPQPRKVVRHARRVLHRSRTAPARLLRKATFGRMLIRGWEKAIRDIDKQSPMPAAAGDWSGNRS